MMLVQHPHRSDAIGFALRCVEILEARAKRIVSELGVCEFILSSDIVSMALAMCAENPAVISILAVCHRLTRCQLLKPCWLVFLCYWLLSGTPEVFNPQSSACRLQELFTEVGNEVRRLVSFRLL